MKRLHVHVSVDDLAQSTRFYSTVCAAEPTKQWVADPQGVPWETFYTYGESTVYAEGSLAKLKEVSEAACCAPTCFGPEAIQTPQPAAATACCTR